jgi:hypothetical protein
MTNKEQKELRKTLLDRQNGLCAICGQDSEYQSSPNKPKQPVNTLDHNHACHPTGEWCKKCVRGMVHAYCNMGIQFIEAHPQYGSTWAHDYIRKGKE